MLKKKIITFVSSEYHLLLFINRIINERESNIENDHSLYIRGNSKFRISKKLNLLDLNIDFHYVSVNLENNKPINESSANILKEFFKMEPDEFVFYQEMDLLVLILMKYWKKNYGTKIILDQDGSKPYFRLKGNSLGVIKFHHQTNIWLKKNGFSINSWLSPLWSHRYAFSKEIDEVFLTFPDAYVNWNNKLIKKTDFVYLEKLKEQLEVVFHWKSELLPVKENAIFYMNQPMPDDGQSEINFLINLTKKFPSSPMYIKLHPLTSESKMLGFSEIPNVIVIRSTIPAELFIMHLKKSIILSVNSTSMFLDNKDCKFYYLSDIFKKDIKRLRRYNTEAHLSPHIIMAKSIDDIDF